MRSASGLPLWDSMATQRTRSSSVSVLWALQGTKRLECVLYSESAEFILSIERGDEQEVFWTFKVGSVGEVLSVSERVRDRLVGGGWRVIHREGEEVLAASMVA